jgi:transposase
MYIDIVPNRNSPPATLLREGWREGGKTHKRTLANISDWPKHKIETLRRLLRDETLISPDDRFNTLQTLPHGHVEVILGMIGKLGLDSMISSKHCRERDLVVAMIAERLIHPCSKLATTREWHSTTLAEELKIQDADENDLYAAMDWLLERKQHIEKKLAKRHLSDRCTVLYDVSSSYYEGRTCPLALFGHDRDGQKGLPIIVYGVLTDADGRPVAIEIYPGNTSDQKTVPDQVSKLQKQFGLAHTVIVGDRGMLTQPQIDRIKQHPEMGWITALTSAAIKSLMENKALQRSLFDERNLAEISSPDYPGERLMACYNPLLDEERNRKRRELLDATDKGLARISKEVSRRKRKPLKESEIAIKVGKVFGRYKMGKHYNYTAGDGAFKWARNEESIKKETSLDGIYVIRTSEPKEQLTTEDTVRTYKSLSQVERAFRCLKGIFDVLVRPIRHRTKDRVPAHFFLCLLAYYVEWHMRRALAPILFEDEELPEDRKRRDPILQPKPSESVKQKKQTHKTVDGLPVHSFDTLMKELAARCRVTERLKSEELELTIKKLPPLNPIQAKTHELLGLLPVTGK